MLLMRPRTIHWGQPLVFSFCAVTCPSITTRRHLFKAIVGDSDLIDYKV
jgi:hypothetical protein